MRDVRVLNTDALANKNTLSPVLIENVQAMLASAPGRVFKLVANLPYNVATPIITNLLVHPELHPALMVVTIQRELAERMICRTFVARPTARCPSSSRLWPMSRSFEFCLPRSSGPGPRWNPPS